jgi:hypothetical protein
MLRMLITSNIRGLGPFWRNVYTKYGDFLNANFTQSDAFITHLVTKILKFSRYSDGLDGRGSIPSKSKIFLFSTASRLALGPTYPPIQRETGSRTYPSFYPRGTGTLSPGVKRLGREAD